MAIKIKDSQYYLRLSNEHNLYTKNNMLELLNNDPNYICAVKYLEENVKPLFVDRVVNVCVKKCGVWPFVFYKDLESARKLGKELEEKLKEYYLHDYHRRIKEYFEARIASVNESKASWFSSYGVEEYITDCGNRYRDLIYIDFIKVRRYYDGKLVSEHTAFDVRLVD